MAPPTLSPRARLLLPLLLIALLAVSLHRYRVEVERGQVELAGEALGTTWSAKIAGTLSPDEQRALQAKLVDRLDEIDRAMSTWRGDSELSRFNAAPPDRAFSLSLDTFRVFEIALQVGALSQGALDVTVLPLVELWGFGATPRMEVAPPADAIAALRRHVGRSHLRLDAEARQLSKAAAGVRVDLSAVAKGYAVDALSEGLKSEGHEHVLVEVGGELRGRGVRPDGLPWRVAVEEPREEGRKVHRIVSLADRAMATSGDYRNYFEHGGRRFSHMLDPRTGAPIEHALASVTVVHESAAWADAWATALNVLGPEAGYALAEDAGLAAYFIVRAPAVRDNAAAFGIQMTDAFAPFLVSTEPTP